MEPHRGEQNLKVPFRGEWNLIDVNGTFMYLLGGEWNQSNNNPRVHKAKNEERGLVTSRAHDLQAQLERARQEGVPSVVGFEEIVYCDIGNPQKLRQGPLRIEREVCAQNEYPELNAEAAQLFAADAVARAQRLLGSGNLAGTYSCSQGHAP